MRNFKKSFDSIRHIPQRTCVACRKARPKRELIRLVRTPDGEVLIDTTGKMSGRGVYLCPLEECCKTGLTGKQLEHSLKTNITRENRKQLIIDIQRLGIPGSKS